MPAPQAMVMKQAARLKFSLNGLRVPDRWTQPSGDPAAQQYADAFRPEHKTSSPDPTTPSLFIPASLNKYHTDVQKQMTSIVGGFLDGICEAICNAWSTWQTSASMVGVLINGPIATLGQVVGPPWQPLIFGGAPKNSPAVLRYSTTVANILGPAWDAYTATIKVPGLPWFPSFAAVPLAIAPPIPNTPVPVSALAQVTASLEPNVLKNGMIAAHGDPTAMYHREIYDAVCDAFTKMFTVWQNTTMVTNVYGSGPVPTFAPPVVPVGPVVAGQGAMPPGGFA